MSSYLDRAAGHHRSSGAIRGFVPRPIASIVNPGPPQSGAVALPMAGSFFDSPPPNGVVEVGPKHAPASNVRVIVPR